MRVPNVIVAMPPRTHVTLRFVLPSGLSGETMVNATTGSMIQVVRVLQRQTDARKKRKTLHEIAAFQTNSSPPSVWDCRAGVNVLHSDIPSQEASPLCCNFRTT